MADNTRQLFHAKPLTSKTEAGGYLSQFLGKVKDILCNEGKYKVFENLMSFPLPTQQIISKSSDVWNTIFQAKDRVIEYDFRTDGLEDDFVKYLSEIALDHIIEQNIFTRVKQSVNTLVIVDVKSAGADTDRSEYAQPVVYMIDASSVVDADENYKGQIEYVLFKPEQKKLVAIDDDFYRVFRIETNDLVLETESFHGLGYCPVCAIWGDNIDTSIPIRRFNAILEALADLDKLVMAEIFREHMDLYAAFVIMWRYVDHCNYTEGDATCQNGKLSVLKPDGAYDHKDCPACKSRGLLGPGTGLDIPIPTDKEQPLINQPMGFVEAGVETLEYNVTKIQQKRAEIEEKLTGGTLSTTANKAFNEDQVKSHYEARRAVLLYWAENFQKVHKFIVDTIGKLRYADSYHGSTINYGKDFFLIDEDTAVKEYKEAKNAGLPMYIVAMKRKVVQDLYTRMSPSLKVRLDLLELLEPYVDMPMNALDPESYEYELKANFGHYIAQFERENKVSIEMFGVKKQPEKRIALITNKLYQYVRDNKQRKLLREQGQGAEIPAV